MGYAHYDLPDGREAGYAVEASCDQPGCTETINRGFAHLCGEYPEGHRDPDEPGCGRYYCDEHIREDIHNCPNPRCPVFEPNGYETCDLVRGHEGLHRNDWCTWEEA